MKVDGRNGRHMVTTTKRIGRGIHSTAERHQQAAIDYKRQAVVYMKLHKEK